MSFPSFMGVPFETWSVSSGVSSRPQRTPGSGDTLTPRSVNAAEQPSPPGPFVVRESIQWRVQRHCGFEALRRNRLE
jgi:hypothetical protein